MTQPTTSQEESLVNYKRLLKRTFRYIGLYVTAIWLSVLLGYTVSEWFFLVWWALWGLPLICGLVYFFYMEITRYKFFENLKVANDNDN